MRVEAKLFEDGMTISNPSPRKGKNPLFFYFDMEAIPRVGELVIIHDVHGGLFIVVAVARQIANGKCCPMIALEKYKGQTRQSILGKFGWLPGNEVTPNAFEVERIALEN